MADLSLDLNPTSPTYRDLLVSSGDLALTSDTPSGAAAGGANPVLQDILQRLRFFLGEWFLDNSQGVPYYQQILVKNPDQSKVAAIFQNIIMGTPGVQQLTKFLLSANRSTRVVMLVFSCNTASGAVNYSGAVTPVSGGLT